MLSAQTLTSWCPISRTPPKCPRPAFSGAQDPIPTPDPDPHDSGQATTTPTTSTSSSSTSTTIWSRLLGGMSSGGASGAGEGGGLDLTWAGGWKRKRLDRDAAAPPPLDSCRRCEAFSAADLAADAPDGSLRVQDPDWQLQQTSYARGAAWLLSVVGDDEQGHERGAGPGAASGDSGGRAKGKGEEEHGVGGPWPKEEGAWPRAGAGAGPQEDVRRRACRAIGPYLDQIPYDRTLREHHHRVVRYIRSPEYRVGWWVGGARGVHAVSEEAREESGGRKQHRLQTWMPGAARVQSVPGRARRCLPGP